VYPNAAGAVLRCYAGISIFIAGSHPYGDFGWSQPLPGAYTQFMTRYGEYCWAQDLTPAVAEESLFSVDADESLWWRELIKERRTAEGRQWVVHLLSAPPAESMAAEKPGKMQPWRRGLAVSRETSREPVVWALSAEPSTRAEHLTPRHSGNRCTVEVPEHRVWTMLVWTEAI
jgi:hypothetical protein